jgi:hypothetical protein
MHWENYCGTMIVTIYYLLSTIYYDPMTMIYDDDYDVFNMYIFILTFSYMLLFHPRILIFFFFNQECIHSKFHFSSMTPGSLSNCTKNYLNL